MQSQLFHDTVYDALGADIAACGGFKVVAGKLWSSIDPTVGAAKLRNALNPEQAQKLDADEVLLVKRLAKDVGSFATVNYEASKLHYEVTWIKPAEQMEKLQATIVEKMDSLNREIKRSQELMREMKAAVRK